MYSVTVKNPSDDFETLVWSDISAAEETKLENIELKMTVNSAGSLSLTLPVTNAGYSKIKHMTTEVIAYRNDVGKIMKEIWRGRVLTEDKDFWKNRVIFCEGELAYLNDTIQPPTVYKNKTIIEFLTQVLYNHNIRVNDEKYKFRLGTVTVEDVSEVYRYTNYENTLDTINSWLIDRLGGILRIRHENGYRYLDYLDTYPNVASQTIEFGKNLTDITQYWDLSDFATVVLPLGNQLDQIQIENKVIYDPGDGTVYKDPETEYPANVSEIEDVFLDIPTLVVGNKDYRRPLGFKLVDDIAKLTYIKPNSTTPTKADIATLNTVEDYYPELDEYLDIADVNDGSPYLINQNGVNAYGRIEKVINYDDITNATDLKTAGQEYLTSIQYDSTRIELSAVDLHYFDIDVTTINLLDVVLVISQPHELQKLFPVTELSIPLNKPEDASITLSGSIDGSKPKLSDITAGTIKTVRKRTRMVGSSSTGTTT